MQSRVNLAATEPQDRRSKILKAVIDLYLKDANPISSKAVSEKVDLGVSPATIRNEMHALEQEGYLSHKYTSSGRVPTDLGYRFFVDNFVANQTLSSNKNLEKKEFFTNLSSQAVQNGSMYQLEDMVVMLSSLTQHTAVVVKESPNLSKICDVHVSILDDHRLVIGLFFEDATIERVVIDIQQCSQPLKSELLNIGDEVLKENCEIVLKENLIGFSPVECKENLKVDRELSSFAHELLAHVANTLTLNVNSDKNFDGTVHVAGVANIAKTSETEFENREISTRLLTLIEEHMTLVEIVRSSLSEKIDAKIGSENELEELHFHSVVLAPIKNSDGLSGAIGVIGPKRMDYFKAFKYTDAVSKIMQENMEN